MDTKTTFLPKQNPVGIFTFHQTKTQFFGWVKNCNARRVIDICNAGLKMTDWLWKQQDLEPVFNSRHRTSLRAQFWSKKSKHRFFYSCNWNWCTGFSNRCFHTGSRFACSELTTFFWCVRTATSGVLLRSAMPVLKWQIDCENNGI